MSYGYMPWGIPDGTKLLNATEPRALAKQIHDLGGYVFFAHTEEPRDWDLPELSGMEIYNIHSNLKKLPGKGDVYARLAPDMILSTRSYPEHVMRKIFERQTKILARWDEANVTRKVVGIAGNDCHQNNGLVARYTEEGTLNLGKTSPGDTIAEWKLNAVTRLLLRACFGKLEPGKQLFRVDFDAYERSVRFVNTHVLAHELTEKDILGAITEGRVFIAFDMIADARGFKYLARTGGKTAVMGETIPFGSDTQLEAESPVPCRFAVVHDGVYGEKQEGRVFTLRLDKPGKYRLEAELNVMNEWIPWVYTNPIEVVAPKS
ncbi:MAG: hypothetical protein HZB26_26065 [Candidatus Hydrogenedentes bacterium]|nr:hypothetical protein [Candidatus Hydrogenedentota bacterium]